jgi:hypothetical protein
MRAGLRRISAMIHQASAPSELWEPVRAAAPTLGAHAVELTLTGTSARYSFAAPAVAVNGEHQRKYCLAGERVGTGTLRLVWSDARSVPPDTDVAVGTLCNDLKRAINRFERARDPSVPQHVTVTADSA